ncbi:hypothetical protein [Nesterenkonia suensis]
MNALDRGPPTALEDRFPGSPAESSEIPDAGAEALERGEGGQSPTAVETESAASAEEADATDDAEAGEARAMERIAGVPTGAWATVGLFLLGALGWTLYFFGWRPGRSS